MKNVAFPTSFALTCIILSGAACGASLARGTYGVSSYYVSAKGTGGGTCSFPAGTYLNSEYVYPGPNKSGAIARTYLNGSSGAFVSVDMLPKTPAAGATSWSGSLTLTVEPGGTAVTGTFSSAITIIDSVSYVDKTTYVFPSNGGMCTSVVQHVGIQTGK